MKAHKKIIIWTFVLSVLFTIETLFLYLFEPSTLQNYYIWIENISIGVLTGFIVAFIIEIGNYSSLKNKLYEKLMGECIRFNDFLNRYIKDIEQCLDIMDKQPDNIEFVKSKLVGMIKPMGDLLESINKENTKVGDFTFVLSSNNPNKGKVNKNVTNTINCFYNMITLSTDIINSNNEILKGNMVFVYNILLHAYKHALTTRQQLDYCVREMERYYKFSKSWDCSLNNTNRMYENDRIQNSLAAFEYNANRKNTIKQAYDAMGVLSNMQNNSQQDAKTSNETNVETSKKKRTKKAQSK